MIKRKQIGQLVALSTLSLALLVSVCLADDKKNKTKETYPVEDVTVVGKKPDIGIKMTPGKNTIDIETYQSVAPPTSVVDLLKTQPAVDFRGESDLDPGVDSIFLRGFDYRRFITAIDGVALMKTGGRKGSNMVDYAALPVFMFDSIDVTTGPHSALFDSRAIGGAINLITKRPEHRNTAKPDMTLTTSYGSYDTINNAFSMSGAVQDFTYDLSLRYFSSDGYLRHSETKSQNVYGRLGYLLPSNGFVALSFSNTETDRNVPVNNPGTTLGDYDSNYPIVDGSSFDPYQDPVWDGDSYTYRFALDQPTPIGDITLNAYTGKDNRTRVYYETPSSRAPFEQFDTQWWQKGGKLQDEYTWANGQVTTLGMDMTWLYDDGLDDEKIERLKKQAGYLQHKLTFLSALDLTLGLRHEDVHTVTTNDLSSPKISLPAYGRYVHRDFDAWLPKSFITWRMDRVGDAFRDTSLSFGVSRIWRAPDYHGDYNMLNRPTGIYLEPEDGIGYDLVFERRLVKDIRFKSDFSFYKIKDFIAGNSDFTQTMGGKPGIQRFSDLMINLEEIYRYGIDLEFSGHLIDDLSFYLAYSWQDFDNRGNEPAGQEELDERAKHHVKAGLRYSPFARTTVMLDYQYQSDQVTDVYEEIATNVWTYHEAAIDAYHTFDLALEQVLVENRGALKDMKLKLYIKNLFDEGYCDQSGYPGTDRTIGAALVFEL